MYISFITKIMIIVFFFSSRRRHTRYWRDWSSDVCSSDLVDGPAAMASATDPEQMAKWAEEFRLGPDETLEGVLAHYEEVARRTDELVRTIPDLDASHPLPEAPWFEPGATRSARRVFLHIVAETAQHAGHADILRESLDGQKTMG